MEEFKIGDIILLTNARAMMINSEYQGKIGIIVGPYPYREDVLSVQFTPINNGASGRWYVATNCMRKVELE